MENASLGSGVGGDDGHHRTFQLVNVVITQCEFMCACDVYR